MQLSDETVVGLYLLSWWLCSLGLAGIIERFVGGKLAERFNSISRELVPQINAANIKAIARATRTKPVPR